MTRTAIYVRVSTVGQNEAGQRAEIEKWLDGHQITEPLWFTDKETGKRLSRPGFRALQQAVFRGEVDTVVVYKLDRLSRSLRDGINVLADWCERGLRVVSVTQGVDFSGAMGRLLASVFFGVAEMETELRAERQAAGIKEARKRGVYTGRKKGTVKGDPGRARQLRDKGLTLPEIARAMGLSRQTVVRYLREGMDVVSKIWRRTL